MSRAQQLVAEHARLIGRLYEKIRPSAAAYGGISYGQFEQALGRSVEHRFRAASPSPSDVAAYLGSLYLEDLALAAALANASEPAWDYFVSQFRPGLYAAARAICRQDESVAREMADSLYAELFGVGRGSVEREKGSAERRSLFDYFHGRSKLSTWLRAILSQRFVDRIRASRRMESLDSDDRHNDVAARTGTMPEPSVSAPDYDPDRERYLSLLQLALAAALAALAPRDRLRLAYYYVQDLTLAQIGRLLGEHEATVSRQLERIRRELHQGVERALRAEKRLSDAQIRLCYEYALEEWPFDLTRALTERHSV